VHRGIFIIFAALKRQPMFGKATILFFLIVFTWCNSGFAQRFTIKVKDDCPPKEENTFLNTDELQADFIGQRIFGEAPLTAKFIDLSTGEPSKWKWQFGDGSSDTLQNAIHVYQDPGAYTVRLTVYDGSDSASTKRVNYVRVAVSGACDSLNYPLPGGEYTLYSLIGIGSGYISGNNSYGTQALASYFDEFEEGGELLAGVFYFGFAERLLTNDVPVYFKVWDATGASTSPGNLLDSVQVPISSIVEDYSFGRPSLIVFNEPIQLDGPFFMGVDLPQIYGDTLALYTNYDGDVDVGNGWEKELSGNWQPYSSTQWNLDIDNAIFPVVCQPVGVDNPGLEKKVLIYPIPANDKINFVLTDVSVEVNSVKLIDMTGRLVLSRASEKSSFGSIQLGGIPDGFYFLRFETSIGAMNKMIVVGR
jgi:PKD repeat protein